MCLSLFVMIVCVVMNVSMRVVNVSSNSIVCVFGDVIVKLVMCLKLVKLLLLLKFVLL